MKNPLYNAVLAEGYICLVASVMFYGQPFVRGEDAVIMPIAMLSLVVLSAALMSYFFFYAPLALFLEGKKEEAVHFFLKTVGSFALMTLVAFVAMFLFF
jgi:hypothetical protein